jgi:hypothetical protein
MRNAARQEVNSQLPRTGEHFNEVFGVTSRATVGSSEPRQRIERTDFPVRRVDVCQRFTQVRLPHARLCQNPRAPHQKLGRSPSRRFASGITGRHALFNAHTLEPCSRQNLKLEITKIRSRNDLGLLAHFTNAARKVTMRFEVLANRINQTTACVMRALSSIATPMLMFKLLSRTITTGSRR